MNFTLTAVSRILRSKLAALLLGGSALLPFASSTAVAIEVPLADATIEDFNKAFSAGTLTSEKLVSLYLTRVKTYEPILNAVITLNPNALEEAKALDAERKAKGPRSALHGIPVVYKDNFDTFDLPTTGGFYGLNKVAAADTLEDVTGGSSTNRGEKEFIFGVGS